MFKNLLNFFETSRLDPLTDWLGVFITHNGILAPMLLLVLEESGVPLPIPGDVYISYTGYLVSKGSIPYFTAFILLLLSVLIGASILYYLSFRYGQIIVLKFGKYIHLDEKKLLTVEEKFRQYGIWVIIFGRHIPGFRVPITVFSGMSGISYKTFILGTFISVIFWIAFYLSVGRQLGTKILYLLHAHYSYYALLLIPFLVFIGFFIYIHLRKRKKWLL